MARRPSEVTAHRPLVAARKPPTPGADPSEGELAGPALPIQAEQEEAFLSRYEMWKSTYNGSLPEFIVWEFLTIDKKQRPQVDFVFQYPLFGGRTRFGGYVLDFFLIQRREGWNVLGERFHLQTAQDRARVSIMRVQLTSLGMNLIELWEDDLITRPDFVLNLAWDRSVDVKSRIRF